MAARGSLELARQQAQLNRLVIEELADGVLVVDRRGRVRAANPAARALLVGRRLAARGAVRAAGRARPGRRWSARSQRAFDRRRLARGRPRRGAAASARGHARTLRVRVRFTRRRAAAAAAPSDAGEDLCVMFLEDLRTLQARMRKEKLAAMGRMSAGIAHEIRNPLAAIAQANALLAKTCRRRRSSS